MIVMVLPGASLMHVTTTADGAVQVHCPGCGERHTYRHQPGRQRHVAFEHGDDCPVHRRILQAQATDAQHDEVTH